MDRVFEVNFTYPNRNPNDFSQDTTLRRWYRNTDEDTALKLALDSVDVSRGGNRKDILKLDSILELDTTTEERTIIKQIFPQTKTTTMKFFNIKKADLINDIKEKMKIDSDIWTMMFDAYNRYQMDERDGVDYIFNLSKQEDLLAVVKAGLTIEDLHQICYKSLDNAKYIHYGCNYEKPMLLTKQNIDNNIYGLLDEIVDDIIAYPWVEEYRKVYTFFITNKIIEDYE